MNLTQMGTLTSKGEDAFRELLLKMPNVANPAERRESALAIIADPELCTPVTEAGFIDLDKRFATALEFAEHVHEAIMPLGTSGIRNRGINLFLYCAFIDQLLKGRARVTDSYFLDEKVKGQSLAVIRNYRNAVFVFLNLYHRHHADAVVCPVLLGQAPSELGNALEKIAQNNNVFESAAILQLIVRMFFDIETGRYRKAPVNKGRKIKGNNAGRALKELSAILLTQCSRNYDISRMTVQEMLKLVPNTISLSGWKKYAEASFAMDEAKQARLKETNATRDDSATQSSLALA